MSAIGRTNVAAVVAALIASTFVAWGPRRWTPVAAATESAPLAPEAAPPVDHSGVALPARHYRRIVSTSAVADELLLELCEPDRVVAFTVYSVGHSADGYRFEGKPTVDLGHLEAVLALHPDLVLVNVVGDRSRVARLREAGLAVYDLGPMRGMATLLVNIQEVAALLGHPERGERFSRALVDRMRTVAIDVPAAARRRGAYLSIYGGRLFGGASGTSFHDVLTAAGLVDAATGYADWPEYSTEQIVAMDPDMIVTHRGMDAQMCEHAGFRGLRACSGAGRVVGIEAKLLDDPGPAMAEAAAVLRDEVYGPPPAPSP